MKCPEHGVVTTSVPWAEPNSGFTAMFEALVIDWLKASTVASRRSKSGAMVSATRSALPMPSTSTLVDSIYTRRVSAGECYPPDLVKSQNNIITDHCCPIKEAQKRPENRLGLIIIPCSLNYSSWSRDMNSRPWRYLSRQISPFRSCGATLFFVVTFRIQCDRPNGIPIPSLA